MKSIRMMAVIGTLAILLTIAMYALINHQMVSIASVGQSRAEAESHDRALCERLIRFGQVAFDRGQVAEAKHFYQKAIMVDPSHSLAWRKYNSALIALISARVETDPGFLPEFSTNDSAGEPAASKDIDSADEDGC